MFGFLANRRKNISNQTNAYCKENYSNSSALCQLIQFRNSDCYKHELYKYAQI